MNQAKNVRTFGQRSKSIRQQAHPNNRAHARQCARDIERVFGEMYHGVAQKISTFTEKRQRHIEGVDGQMRHGKRPSKIPIYGKMLQADGNRQQATGNRQQATGNRQQATKIIPPVIIVSTI